MKTLEELLQELGCEGSAFDSTGEFTKAGEKGVMNAWSTCCMT